MRKETADSWRSDLGLLVPVAGGAFCPPRRHDFGKLRLPFASYREGQ